MGLYIKNKEKFSDSPFFRFILYDVSLSKLKLYQSRKGNRKTREKYKEDVPETSIFPAINNKGFRGLPVPIKVAKECNFFHDSSVSKEKNFLGDSLFPSKWILAYHNLEKINFLLLFPAIKNKRSDNFVEDKDFSLESKEDLLKNKIDFQANKIYIYPYLIERNKENKGYFNRKDGKIYDRFFLEVPDFYMSTSISDTINWEMENYPQDKPSKRSYSLFYDDLGHLLYINHRYRQERFPTLPNFIEFIPGCEWPRVKISQRDTLSKFDYYLNPKNWLSG